MTVDPRRLESRPLSTFSTSLPLILGRSFPRPHRRLAVRSVSSTSRLSSSPGEWRVKSRWRVDSGVPLRVRDLTWIKEGKHKWRTVPSVPYWRSRSKIRVRNFFCPKEKVMEPWVVGTTLFRVRCTSPVCLQETCCRSRLQDWLSVVVGGLHVHSFGNSATNGH